MAGTTVTSSPSGGPTPSPRPPEGLSPRRAAQMEKARQTFESKVALITHRTTRDLRDTDPAYRPTIERNAKQQIERLREDLERTLHRIQHPATRPASSEPAHRVVGFEVKPKSP